MNRKWTFLITETRVANHRVKVLGHFVFFLHGIDEKKHPRGQETQFSIQYLTKPEEPVEFELPTWFFKESGVNPKSISVDVVEKYLHDLFERKTSDTF